MWAINKATNIRFPPRKTIALFDWLCYLRQKTQNLLGLNNDSINRSMALHRHVAKRKIQLYTMGIHVNLLMETPANSLSLRPLPLIVGLCESLDLFNSIWVDYIGEKWLAVHYNGFCNRGSWIVVSLTWGQEKHDVCRYERPYASAADTRTQDDTHYITHWASYASSDVSNHPLTAIFKYTSTRNL